MEAGEKIMHPRLQILSKLDELQDEHCKNCDKVKISDGNGRNSICNNQCDIGKKIQHLGQLLLEHRAKKVKVMKSKCGTKILSIPKKKESVILKKELTKEALLSLKDEGKTNREIMDIYGLNNAKFYKLKNDWGLVESKYSRAKNEEVKEEKVEVEAGPNWNEVKEGLGNLINKRIDWSELPLEKIIFDEKKCGCNNDKSRQLEDKVLELQSKIAILEKDNGYLLDHINSLNKYKNMYFATANTLKIHLP